MINARKALRRTKEAVSRTIGRHVHRKVGADSAPHAFATEQQSLRSSARLMFYDGWHSSPLLERVRVVDVTGVSKGQPDWARATCAHISCVT